MPFFFFFSVEIFLELSFWPCTTGLIHVQKISNRSLQDTTLQYIPFTQNFLCVFHCLFRKAKQVTNASSLFFWSNNFLSLQVLNCFPFSSIRWSGMDENKPRGKKAHRREFVSRFLCGQSSMWGEKKSMHVKSLCFNTWINQISPAERQNVHRGGEGGVC